jgi:glycosyltransferase involved in cell wall biosynthesis
MHNNSNDKISEELVSIIIPAYNCEGFIGRTLESVLSQTYKNWEAIIIDDCSTDNTLDLVKSYSLKNQKIRYQKLSKNSGAAVARNAAVNLAKGKYLAFLDSDDIWFPEKLEQQIKFMQDNGYLFTCTSYNKIDSQGNDLGFIIRAKNFRNYNGVLKRNPGNSTVIYDAESLGKIIIPDIRKRNDYVMWLQVVKKAKILHGLDEVLTSHRIRTGSLSRNKVGLVYYHWKVYRKIENLSLIRSSYLIVYWIIATVFKLR